MEPVFPNYHSTRCLITLPYAISHTPALELKPANHHGSTTRRAARARTLSAGSMRTRRCPAPWNPEPSQGARAHLERTLRAHEALPYALKP